MKNFYKRLMDVENEALNFILKETKERTFTIKTNGDDNTTDMSIGVYSNGKQVDIDIHKISAKGVKGWAYYDQKWVEVDWQFSSHERGNFAWIADYIEKVLIEEEEDADVPREKDGVSLTDEQRELYRELADIDAEPYLYAVDGVLFCEVNTYTNGGVNEVISCEFDIDKLIQYIDEFDIDTTIDTYRMSEDYKKNFTIQESVQDFVDWCDEWRREFDTIRVLIK